MHLSQSASSNDKKISPDTQNEPGPNRLLDWLGESVHGNLLLNTPKNPSPVLATNALSQIPRKKEAS